MTGIKVETVWIPPPIPSARIVLSHSGLPMLVSRLPKPWTKMAPKRISKKSIKADPMLIEKMNIKYIMKRKIGIPSQRFRTILSILSVVLWSISPLRIIEAAVA